ncbi:MAG: hypothetical protein JO317_07990, partial [Verrucomicrobiae bacterium]|nr:hypothetical protein [Verrucomicrobiae bacterium]
MIAVCLILKAVSWGQPHTEPDEQVYWQLARNLSAGRSYTLQGTDILKNLSPAGYDKPLFHHPPLYSYLLSWFVRWRAPNAAVLISWFGHALAIASVAWVARRILLDAIPEAEAMHPLFWMPILLAAADPQLTCVSAHLWTDSLLAGLVAAGMALAIAPPRRGSALAWHVAAGVIFGLALLVKLVAAIAL